MTPDLLSDEQVADFHTVPGEARFHARSSQCGRQLSEVQKVTAATPAIWQGGVRFAFGITRGVADNDARAIEASLKS